MTARNDPTSFFCFSFEGSPAPLCLWWPVTLWTPRHLSPPLDRLAPRSAEPTCSSTFGPVPAPAAVPAPERPRWNWSPISHHRDLRYFALVCPLETSLKHRNAFVLHNNHPNHLFTGFQRRRLCLDFPQTFR